MILWNRYVLRRGSEVEDMWDQMFKKRRVGDTKTRLLYVGGRGFDLRAQAVMTRFIGSLDSSGCSIERAELLLVGFSGYELSDELKDATEANAACLEGLFASIGTTRTIMIESTAEGEDDLSANNALRMGTEAVLRAVSDQTDIVTLPPFDESHSWVNYAASPL